MSRFYRRIKDRTFHFLLLAPENEEQTLEERMEARSSSILFIEYFLECAYSLSSHVSLRINWNKIGMNEIKKENDRCGNKLGTALIKRTFLRERERGNDLTSSVRYFVTERRTTTVHFSSNGQWPSSTWTVAWLADYCSFMVGTHRPTPVFSAPLNKLGRFPFPRLNFVDHQLLLTAARILIKVVSSTHSIAPFVYMRGRSVIRIRGKEGKRYSNDNKVYIVAAAINRWRAPWCDCCRRVTDGWAGWRVEPLLHFDTSF